MFKSSFFLRDSSVSMCLLTIAQMMVSHKSHSVQMRGSQGKL